MAKLNLAVNRISSHDYLCFLVVESRSYVQVIIDGINLTVTKCHTGSHGYFIKPAKPWNEKCTTAESFATHCKVIGTARSKPNGFG
jgi:hypothetical protein